MSARDAIETAARDNGWTLDYSGDDSWGAGTDTWSRNGVILDVTFSIAGVVVAGVVTRDGENVAIPAKGKREAILAMIEETEDDGTADLAVCDDCANLLANGGCDGCESCVFSDDPDSDDCQTVNDRFMAKWGDQWSGVMLGDGELGFSTAECDGCGQTDHGDRHRAHYVPRLVTLSFRVEVPRPPLAMRGRWNRKGRATRRAAA